MAHLPHQTQKIPLIRCSICVKFLPFNGTNTNGKLKILFYSTFALSSHFFIWFYLSLLRISLSLSLSQVPNQFLHFSQSDASKKKVAQRRQRRRPIIVILHNHHLSQPQPPPQQQNPNPKKPNKPTTAPPYLNPQPPLATKLNQIHSNKTQILQQNLNPKNL